MENPDKEKLLIFVGEKIEVKEMEPDKSSDPLDLPYAKFKARYKVLDVLCGQYNKKEITFIAYDHYGVPAFERYENVILYVYNYKDTFYHESYLFDALYKTKEGKWASPPSWLNYDFEDSIASKIKPREIEYENEVSFDVKGLSRKALARSYPIPYYSIQNKRAIAKYGNYLDEVVQLKKDRALKARGYYGKTADNKIKIQDVTLADIKQVDESQMLQKDKSELVKAAYRFFDFLRRRDSAAVRQISFDSVFCSICEEPPRRDYENNLETFDSFYVSTKKYLTFSQLELEIKNKVFEVSARKIEPAKENSLIRNTGIEVVYSIDFTVIENFDGYRSEQKHRFEFVKMNGVYKFYGMRTEENGSKYVRDY